MNYILKENGLILPEYFIKKPKRPTHFDFFCGAGGFGCGMVQAGFETVGANEFDAAASITYMVNLGHYPMSIHYLDGDEGKAALNKTIAATWGLTKKSEYEGELTPEILTKIFGNDIKPSKAFPGSGWINSTGLPGCENFWFGDIRKLTGKMILDTLGMKQGELDCVTGGPPCQGFSRAGKQRIDDPRNNLVYEYARMINELQPKTFIMENVPDLVNFYDPDGVPVLDKFCLLLQEGGYGKWENIKKSMATQAGSAGIIKSPIRGNEKMADAKRKTSRKKAITAKEHEQISLM